MRARARDYSPFSSCARACAHTAALKFKPSIECPGRVEREREREREEHSEPGARQPASERASEPAGDSFYAGQACRAAAASARAFRLAQFAPVSPCVYASIYTCIDIYASVCAKEEGAVGPSKNGFFLRPHVSFLCVVIFGVYNRCLLLSVYKRVQCGQGEQCDRRSIRFVTLWWIRKFSKVHIYIYVVLEWKV